MGQYFSSIVFAAILAYFVVHAVMGERDSTDSPTERSGLILYTDHGTGVQYVSTMFGFALTVRVDRDGKPVTVKP